MGEQVMDEMEVGDAISLLRVRLEALETKAAYLCKQHFDFVMAENKARAWEQKSVLYAQARMRDNTLSVIWYEVHWYGSKAAKSRRMTKKLIRKPKGKHGYNLDALLKLAQLWEVDMVRDAEHELCRIRREATFIGKAIGQLNHIIKRESCFR
ncbi:MAG: conjugative transfer protein MobI(A/C) [Methylophilus sp.]|nr:conjugative transfer protein MobI(A/C) [Methylophilus sp.]